MDSKEIESKVKEIGKKVAEVSKSAFDKASDKVQDFTDKSILKIDWGYHNMNDILLIYLTRYETIH